MKPLVILLLISLSIVAKGQLCLGNYNFNTAAPFDAVWINGCATGSSCSGGESFTNMAACEPTTTLDACAPAPTSCAVAPTGSDLWYSFWASSANATINVIQNTSFVAAIQAFAEGVDCATMTEIGCVVAGGPSSGVQLNLTGLTIGSRYYFRVFGTATPSAQRTGIFCFCGSTGLGGSPLALSLVLQAEENEGDADLSWYITGNTTIGQFEVERANKALEFSPVAWIDPSLNPNATDFAFHEYDLPSGSYFYRIRATGNNGTVAVSNIVAVEIKSESTFVIVGNPSRDILQVDAVEGFEGSILNLNSAVLQACDIQAGRTQVDVSRLSPGIYFLRNGSTGEFRKFLVVHS